MTATQRINDREIGRNENGLYESNEVSTLDFGTYKDLVFTTSASSGAFTPRGIFVCAGGMLKIGVTGTGTPTAIIYVFPSGQVEYSTNRCSRHGAQGRRNGGHGEWCGVKRSARGSSAFTLTEVMVAIMLFALSAAGLFALSISVLA